MSFFDRTVKAGLLLTKFSIFLFLFFAFVPVGYNLQVFMERQTPQMKVFNNDHQYDGIIVLGGCMSADLSAIYGVPIITDSCERILEGIKLHKRFPNARFVYTGGSGRIGNQKDKGADAARSLMQELDVDVRNIVFEKDSRNTYENAVLSRDLVHPLVNEKWLLVTSALHMPRASSVFCQNGWHNITPYPVDYRTDGTYKLSFMSPIHNYRYLTKAVKEVVGILAYRFAGKLSFKACAK